jgi:hypothetical protein
VASGLEQIEAAIGAAIAPGFRNQLLARGEARSIIWRDGELPEDPPNFSPLLSYDLLSYGYSLLGLGLRLRELGGNDDMARLAFENAASALEAVILKGNRRNSDRGFHHLIAAAAYHLGRFSARAYSLLMNNIDHPNVSPIERCLTLLILRRLHDLERTCSADRR